MRVFLCLALVAFLSACPPASTTPPAPAPAAEGAAPAPAPAPAEPEPQTPEPAPEPAPEPEPQTPEPEPLPTDAPASLPSMSVEECQKVGKLVGDPGDGRTRKPGFVCPNGKAPIGVVASGIEGAACCPN